MGYSGSLFSLRGAGRLADEEMGGAVTLEEVDFKSGLSSKCS